MHDLDISLQRTLLMALAKKHYDGAWCTNCDCVFKYLQFKEYVSDLDYLKKFLEVHLFDHLRG
jgi:hypothetical protein